MTKLGFVLLICLTLHSVLSYYGHPPYPRVVYRQYGTPYQQQVPFMPAPVIPVLQTVQTMHYAAPPPPPPPPVMGAARHVTYFAPPPMPPPNPHHHPHHYPHPHYIPAASHQQSYYSPYVPPPTPSPKRPFKNMFSAPFGSYSHHVPKASIFTKIKPYIFGGTGPRSLPHHPYYPNIYHPHQFTPNRPYHNRPAAHHAYPVHMPPPAHHSSMLMSPQKSCSCSLHVGQITVYKHTDMRSSYSCTDLKDCNSFCTNLFSSEDLRAQTRADACLILGKDQTVPWFRRDHVCEPHGTKNDTKLSVDLCCKNLQPC